MDTPDAPESVTPPVPAPLPVAQPVPVPPLRPAREHSGLGLASLIVAAVVAIGIFAVIVLATVYHAQGRGARDPAVMLVGLLIIGLLGLDLVALGLGIAALCQKNRKKVLGILGVVFSGLTVLGTMMLVALGLIVQHGLR